MDAHILEKQQSHSPVDNKYRAQLLADLPVTEHRINLAGISSAVLTGGEGSPVILLHGPGESSIWWMRVIPKLIKTHRVIIPDLPGHGSSKIVNNEPDADLIFAWLSELIEQTCSSPPILVGNILGGSIAARFAINHRDEITQLVLVNSLGLGKFRPAPGFAFGLFRFMFWPTRKNFDHFFPQCIYNVDDLSSRMGKYWEPFLEYNLECARDPDLKAAMQILMKQLGIPKIPSEKLAQISVPVALIWGRHDRANKLRIAEAAGKNYGWPLHVIEKTRDDPKLERPEAFVNALHSILENNNNHK